MALFTQLTDSQKAFVQMFFKFESKLEDNLNTFYLLHEETKKIDGANKNMVYPFHYHCMWIGLMDGSIFELLHTAENSQKDYPYYRVRHYHPDGESLTELDSKKKLSLFSDPDYFKKQWIQDFYVFIQASLAKNHLENFLPSHDKDLPLRRKI